MSDDCADSVRERIGESNRLCSDRRSDFGDINFIGDIELIIGLVDSITRVN